jgi:putative cell wall-binding protein
VVDRIYGEDRYATAAAVATATFAGAVPVVYVATGENFPDALAATPAAAREGGPVLLVSPRGVTTPVAEALNKLQPGRIVVLGGEASVPAHVLNQLSAFAITSRVFGADRYATAVEVSRRTFAGPVARVYVATGMAFPDALAAGAAAGRDGVPVLLVKPEEIPAAVQTELRRLAPSEIVILGAPASVSPQVERQLGGLASAVTRMGGADRYGTAGALAQERYTTSTRAFIATGLNHPDALAGGVAAALTGAPIFLVPGNCVPAYVGRQLATLGTSRVTILGSTAAVAPRVDALAECATPDWLARLNVLRNHYGAGPLVEDPLLSGDDAAHIYYMRKTGDFNHAENQASPYYTPNGNRGGTSSNLFWGRVGIPAVNGWATGPFHALGMFEPTATVAGYADGGGYAALGFGKYRATAVSWPLTFPSNRARIDLYTYDGNEWPNPLATCSGYSAPTGLPILVSLGPRQGAVTSATATLRSGGTTLPVCVVTESSYTSSDASAATVGRAILARNHTVVVVPKAPLKKATTYEVTVVVGGVPTSFSFTTA